MGNYANGRLIYGIIETDETAALFSAIKEKFIEQNPEVEEEGDSASYPFEELYQSLQEKHNISLSSVGYDDDVDIIAAFEVSAFAKDFDCQTINAEDLTKIGIYNENLQAFFSELEINIANYPASWHILGYMD